MQFVQSQRPVPLPTVQHVGNACPHYDTEAYPCYLGPLFVHPVKHAPFAHQRIVVVPANTTWLKLLYSGFHTPNAVTYHEHTVMVHTPNAVAYHEPTVMVHTRNAVTYHEPTVM